MTRGITVKVPTDKVLTMLKAKLAEMEQTERDYPAIQAKYDAEVAAWEQKCVKYAIKNYTKASAIDATSSYSSSNQAIKVAMYFDLAEMPKRPKNPTNGFNPANSYQWNNELDELKQTIKLLEMHDGDHISTATYKNVARFL